MKTRAMARRQLQPAFWVYARILAAAGILLCLLPRQVLSQDVEFEVFTDSGIELMEISEEGSYYSRNISMTCLSGEVNIIQVIDGEREVAMLPYDLYKSLWDFASSLGLISIGDAPMENAFPGQSDFDYLFRDGDQRLEFSAYAVDYLTDTRYRDLARAIIGLADRTFSDEPPPPPID